MVKKKFSIASLLKASCWYMGVVALGQFLFLVFSSLTVP